MMFSTPKQRQLIGFLRKTLRLKDDIYREILASYGVSSSKFLTYENAQKVIDGLKNKAIGLGLYSPKTSMNYSKYDNMIGRYGYATPKQLRKIEAMWMNISTQCNHKAKEIALNHFVKRICAKDHIKFLTQADVSKIIKAIEAMEEAKGVLKA